MISTKYLVLLLLFNITTTYSQSMSEISADYVFYGGEIYTVDANRTWANTLAIRDNKIVYVGQGKGAKKYISDTTEVVNLDGKMVLPGFQDSHIHPISSTLKRAMCSLFNLTSYEAYIKKIKQCVITHSKAKWIHGAGWSHRILKAGNPNKQMPDKRVLDELIATIPLTLVSYDGHSLWANSKALEIAGVNEMTQDVTSGEILRYPNSKEPTGIFLEHPAAELVLKAKPKYTKEQVYRALMAVQKKLNGLGITSVQDALINVGDDGGIYESIEAYYRAAKNNQLTMRVSGAMYWDPKKGMEQAKKMIRYREKYSYGKFRVSSVKVWQDGVMHTHTSHLLEDYSDKPGERGLVMIPSTRLNALVEKMDKAGFQMHFHADGDGALRQCLDAVEQAIKANGEQGNRHHIAHLELVHPDDIPRFRTLNVTANVQPMWSTSKSYILDLIEVKLGEKRKPWLEINKTFIDQGVMVAYGSDWSVTTANPMEIIEAAVTRIRPSLPINEKRKITPLLPDESVDVAQAIASYTINGAHVNHQETTTGSLEVGKLADFIVLDKNIFDVEQTRISETKVLLTFVDGKLVHGALPLSE